MNRGLLAAVTVVLLSCTCAAILAAGDRTPEQIGDAALFLCSDAAAQIRGIALPVDGGWTAQ